jgi:ribosomal subunit interface protein
MSMTPRVTFRNLDPSPALTDFIGERLTKLTDLHDTILSCEAVLESPHRHHVKGRAFHVRLLLSMRRAPPVVAEVNDEDCHAAIREAFQAARRMIEDRADKVQSRRRGAGA